MSNLIIFFCYNIAAKASETLKYNTIEKSADGVVFEHDLSCISA
jgi:hypothetical protein